MTTPYDQPFPVTLAAIRKGALVNELTEELARQVAARFRPEPVARWELPALPAARSRPVIEDLEDTDGPF